MKWIKYVTKEPSLCYIIVLVLVGCRSQKEVVDVRLDSVAVREVCVRDSVHTDFTLRFDSLELYVLDDEGVRLKQVMHVKGGEMVRTKTKTKTKTEADSTCVKTKTITKTKTMSYTYINWYIAGVMAILFIMLVVRIRNTP